MASPEELTPSLPDTLPEDFNEWDGEASPAPLPVNSNEWEAWEASHSFTKASKPDPHSAERKSVAPPVIDRSRDKRPAPSASASAKPQKDLARETSPVPLRVNSNEWEAWAASFGRPAKPLSQAADRATIVSTAAEKPHDTRRGLSASVVSKQQGPATEVMDQPSNHATHAPEASHAASEVAVAVDEPIAPGVEEKASEAAPVSSPQIRERLFTSVALKDSEATEERGMSKKKKQMIVGATSACVILPALLLLIPLMHHGAKAATKPVTETVPAATDTEMQTETPNPAASAPLTQDKATSAAQKQQISATQPADEAKETNSAPALTSAQAQMMNEQLSAPTRIPQNANQQMAENAPPPASLGVDGLGGSGANVSIFSGHAQPVVKASGPVAISSGVATGMLIQKTPPVYPAIAKSARVAGTVELHAIIAKNGTIKNLQVVSGPEMLRQAAVDAVRTWRYRPYKLDNEPAEVETTINVVFTLGG